MDYMYENLGDERFQEFCSRLISKEFSNTQTFPVGQPDGGRDSLAYLMSSSKKEFIVFQVKFVRNPHQQRDVHKWLVDIINDEIGKIDKLIPKGAVGYYLLTNVKGTSHLDKGSIDQLNKVLEKSIKIPAICWWRDDLSMLLDKDPLFKWSFPEILNGQDVLNATVFGIVNENKEKRESAIRAYLADQYSIDREVKFKQIDLQNRLFKLFTDVPLRVKKIDRGSQRLKSEFDYLRRTDIDDELLYLTDERSNIGAAEFVLNLMKKNEIKKIVLEGGPGQGKSTIAQYICQVHRCRLLSKKIDLELIPKSLLSSPICLPFKVDLRHVSDWVIRENPYQEIISEEYFNKVWQKSLESFMVCHIFYHSQISEFNSADFIAICKTSQVLMVFDGFDEIANLEVRKDVIDLINKGISRISENSKAVQVIVTSRPAAFSESISFSMDSYPHFELTDITPAIIREYVEKWTKASELDNRESSELKRLVQEKLEMPHLRDLAKSPMQLAILISLLRTRGESLPNKRTALYDSYIELFFNREAEKNKTIRDQRDLIIDIHKYLAWILHSDAELHRNNGIIHIDALKVKLNEYLIKEGHKTAITDSLFKVVEERVCALVSRVQGTFEFEVQPLREYFCAKYLYETAPYSPVGLEKSGTKPDRFEAISRNFYWQNVVRFFAGCFDKGELPMLIEKIKELQNDSILKHTNYPRILTSQLLSDYVFTQYPIYLKDVVKIIVDGVNVGAIINQSNKILNNEAILLPDDCGRKEVINECFSQLKQFPPSDYAAELIGLIVNNPYNTLESWENYYPGFCNEKLTEWLEYAYKLEIIHKINNRILLEILEEDAVEIKQRIQLIANGNRFELIEKNLEFKKSTLEGVLAGNLFLNLRKWSESSLHFLTFCLNPALLSFIIDGGDVNVSFIDYANKRLTRGRAKNTVKFDANDYIDSKVQEFHECINEALLTEISKWKVSIEPWDLLVESGRKIFGDYWAFNMISVLAAGVRSKSEQLEEFKELNNARVSLCKRARYARLKSGNVSYWSAQLKDMNNISFSLLLFFTWATPRVIEKLLPFLIERMPLITSSQLEDVTNGLKKVAHVSTYNKAQQKIIEGLVNEYDLPDDIKYLLSFRFPVEKRDKFIYKNIHNHSIDCQEVLDLKLGFAISEFLSNTEDKTVLNEVKNIYLKAKGYKGDVYYYSMHRHSDSVKIPFNLAQEIMSECKSYPRIIASFAERACKQNALENLTPVGSIAESEQWFSY